MDFLTRFFDKAPGFFACCIIAIIIFLLGYIGFLMVITPSPPPL